MRMASNLKTILDSATADKCRQTSNNAAMLPASGFTLIELLVIIAVVSMLMGILTPTLGRARAAATRTYCKSNLRQIGIAFIAYLDDNRNILPAAVDIPSSDSDPNNITAFLLPLLRQPRVFKCKADRQYKYYEQWGTSYHYYRRFLERLVDTDRQSGSPQPEQPISILRLAQSGNPLRNIHVMSDYDAFHGRPGKPGSTNYLYADWHVGDLLEQN